MVPTFCPPTIWTISLELYRKPSILAADDFLGACYRKAMTPKKLWTLLFRQRCFKTCKSIEDLNMSMYEQGKVNKEDKDAKGPESLSLLHLGHGGSARHCS